MTLDGNRVPQAYVESLPVREVDLYLLTAGRTLVATHEAQGWHSAEGRAQVIQAARACGLEMAEIAETLGEDLDELEAQYLRALAARGAVTDGP